MYAKETLDAIAAVNQPAAPKASPFPDHPHAAASPQGYDPEAHPYPKHIVVGKDEKGFPTKTAIVNNEAEEAALTKETAGE